MRQQQAFDDVLSLPGLGQQELRSPADDVHPMPQEFFQHPLERQHPRLAVDQRQENQRERVLQRRELIKLIEHDLGIGVALQFQHQPHRLFQIAFVADIAEMPLMRSSFTMSAIRSAIGSRACWNGISLTTIRKRFLPCSSMRVRARTGDRAAAGDDSRGECRRGRKMMPPVGKSGPGTISSSSSIERVGIVDQRDQRVADFAQVVRRNRRGHADRDAVGAVDQQVRKLRRQHGRLEPLFVVSRNEIDRVELEVFEQHRGRSGDMRASVYRMAAGGSPAIEPKLPCLSISTCRMFHSWAMRTSVG